jgi:hypothetical protein
VARVLLQQALRSELAVASKGSVERRGAEAGRELEQLEELILNKE